MKFKVILSYQNGYYQVRVPALEGCLSQGKTKEEAIQKIKDAIITVLDEESQIFSAKGYLSEGTTLEEVDVPEEEISINY